MSERHRRLQKTNVHGPYREEVWAITDRYAAVAKHRETARPR